jgi:hypothetical protein
MEETPASDSLPDLSPLARGLSRNFLLAGSAGYPHFLHQVSAYISPAEASNTRRRFRAASRIFWLSIVVFLAAYFALNGLIGPHSLLAAAIANDFLRAAFFWWSIFLTRRARVGVASQLLLPLAMLCFLPTRSTPAPDWSATPAFYAILVFSLLLIGWLIDQGCAHVHDAFTWVRRSMLVVAPLLLIVLCVAAWIWITDHGSFPVLTIFAALGAIPFLLFGAPAPLASSDVEFLTTAAWRRWRFYITGRVLAVLLGAVPFILFTNLLDYQEQIEECLHVDQAPEILRIPFGHQPWHAFYWRQQGRFLTSDDLAEPEKDAPTPTFIYLTFPTTAYPDPDLPQQYRDPKYAVNLPPDVYSGSLEARMLALNGVPVPRELVTQTVQEFAPYRIDSLGRLLNRVDLASGTSFLSISYHPVTADKGVLIAEKMDLHWVEPKQLERIVLQYSASKWVFFGFGILGFLFLWRRGGDSSLARWIGIWLIGTNLIPTLESADDTFARPIHWLWEQSFVYHWNTFASAGAPLFVLLFGLAGALGLGWLAQVSPSYCWISLCWPTRLYPQHPPILRHVIIFGKMLAALFFVDIFITIIMVTFKLLHWDHDGLDFVTVIAAWTVLFLPAGFILRRFTRQASEAPYLGPWPALAVVLLNLSLMCYAPVIMVNSTSFDRALPWLADAGAAFGVLFLVLAMFLILKRDFLRLRAIASFTTIVLLLAIPFVFHAAEEAIPPLLTRGPFFRERGAEMVTIMLVVLVFPFLHEYMHEMLLFMSVPLLRRIEHRVEHALERIIDANTSAERAELVSELLDEIHVSHYLFLSRRKRGVFAIDINTLPPPPPKALSPLPLVSVELSEPLRDFLGKRRHFIDLNTLAFEWPLFFHQFELHRLARVTRARFLLPISVGDSLRGLLLLADGPPESVIATPALSTNINNLALAAALSRPSR